MDKTTDEIRAAFSGLAMAAMVPQWQDCAKEDRPKVIAENAVRYADALLAELAKTATP
jgi:hypothetical protein